MVSHLKVDSRQFTSGLNKGRGALSSFASHAKTAFAALTAATGAAAVGFGVMAVKMAASAEQTAIAFEVMTGSASRAGELIADLRKMGAATPFEFTDLADSTKTLLSFGRTADDVLTDLDMLSNIASGDAQKLSSLSLVFGQIAANSRMTGGDLLQLVNTGFNPLNQIATKTGETMLELRTRMSKGLIGFEEVRQAFKDATSAGGLFYQMNEKQSQTLLGKWSTMKDEINSALLLIGDSLAKNLDLKGITANITEMATVFKDDWVPALEEFIKLAPELLKAFGEIGKGVGKVATGVDKALTHWQKLNLVATGLATGTSMEDMAQAFKESQGGGFGASGKFSRIGGEASTGPAEGIRDIAGLKVRFSPHKGPQTRDEMLAKEARDAQAGQIRKLSGPAEQMLAGFIRDGIAAMQSGVMSLGGPTKGEPTNQVGSLERGSQEAFDVLRQNMKPGGGQDIQKKQLTVQEKSLEAIKKLEKTLGRKLKASEKVEYVFSGID